MFIFRSPHLRQSNPGCPINGEARTGAKLNKIYTEFHFFKLSPDGSTVEVVYSFPAPLHCVTRGKLARDDRLLWYVAGFFMRWEYKETERGCRSPGARGARRTSPLRFAKPLSARGEGTAAPLPAGFQDGGEVLPHSTLPSTEFQSRSDLGQHTFHIC